MNHICRGKKTNLGAVEYKEAVAAVVDLSRPPEISQPNQVLKRERGTYSQYSGEDCVKIGKFASKNGNKKTLKRFAKEFPNLKESTVCTFKKSKSKSKSTFCPNKRRKHPAAYVPCNAKTWMTTIALRAGQQTGRLFTKPQSKRWLSEWQCHFSSCKSTN